MFLNDAVETLLKLNHPLVCCLNDAVFPKRKYPDTGCLKEAALPNTTYPETSCLKDAALPKRNQPLTVCFQLLDGAPPSIVKLYVWLVHNSPSETFTLQ